MMKYVIITGLLIASLGQFAYAETIPEWIHNNSKMWSEGRANDSDFVLGIIYLINEGVLSYQEINYISCPINDTKGCVIAEPPPFTIIPSWLKNNAGWWTDGLISDDDFLNGIQFLLDNRIIVVR